MLLARMLKCSWVKFKKICFQGRAGHHISPQGRAARHAKKAICGEN
jgi:hypothetical protein